ncbi:hypothetical protein OH687_11270 [Burkholderia anthina]|nr:hypothetical protein OH687_11270 [Burkholderia anthina]
MNDRRRRDSGRPTLGMTTASGSRNPTPKHRAPVSRLKCRHLVFNL